MLLGVVAPVVLGSCTSQDREVPLVREATDVATPVLFEPLIATSSYDGIVTASEREWVRSGGDGVVTSVARTGDPVAPGSAVATIDEEPVIVIPGATPAYRDIVDPDIAADGTYPPPLVGEDVRALTTFLAAVGALAGPPGDVFDEPEVRAAQSWRQDHGLVQRRGFLLSELAIVAVPQPWVVSEVSSERGTSVSAGAELVEVAGSGRSVAVDVPRSVDEASGDWRVDGDPATPTSAAMAAPAAVSPDEVASEDRKQIALVVAEDSVVATLPVGTSVSVVDRRMIAPVGAIIPAGAVRLTRAGHLFVRCRPDRASPWADCPIEVVAHDGASVAVTGDLLPGSSVLAPP